MSFDALSCHNFLRFFIYVFYFANSWFFLSYNIRVTLYIHIEKDRHDVKKDWLFACLAFIFDTYFIIIIIIFVFYVLMKMCTPSSECILVWCIVLTTANRKKNIKYRPTKLRKKILPPAIHCELAIFFFTIIISNSIV